ncbi:MAG: M23 family metallopeptidase [Patescibacteria group bacterium]|nr:M23 family metallopeptidase [Patescibacteria group bacterium]
MRLIHFILLGSILALFSAVLVPKAQAGTEIKLPYAKGERFVVAEGYFSPPTHVKKDDYAIDFTQNGCNAYGKPAVAALAGRAWVVQDSGYNGGYGTQLLVLSDGNVVGRYAHLIPGSIKVQSGDAVRRGMPLGEIGNTGLVMGAACSKHPGTHLHFAFYDKQSDGTFIAHDPEPISGYTDIAEGDWYLSDNAPEEDLAGSVLGVSIGNEMNTAASATNTIQSSSATSSPAADGLPTVVVLPAENLVSSVPAGTVGAGGVSAAPPPPALQDTPQRENQNPDEAVGNTTLSGWSDDASSSSEELIGVPTSSDRDFAEPPLLASATFNSSTLAVDLDWQWAAGMVDSGTVRYAIFNAAINTSSPVAATSSLSFGYPVAPSDFGQNLVFSIQAEDSSGSTLAFATTSIRIPDWFTIIQPNDDTGSMGSWYDDNWYDLGTGFYGTIRSLIFKGAVNTDRYPQFGNDIAIEEFLDSDYSRINQVFDLGSAPLTDVPATITLRNLSIPLQPNKYYRLATVEQLQNHSVILEGTAATGTAMWNEFVNGTGIVRHTYSFYPYLAAVMVPEWPPLTPPNPPANMSFSFDKFNLKVGVSWPTSTDPDTNWELLNYEFNLSTSTALDDSQWVSMDRNLSTSTHVQWGNSYLFGVRAVDDFGHTSTPLLSAWNFPSDFTFYTLGNWLSSASQDFVLQKRGLLHSIQVFTGDFGSGSRYPEYNWCTMDIYDLEATSTDNLPLHLAANDGLNRAYGGCLGQPVTFVFDSANLELQPGHHYRWVLNANTGNLSTQASVRFYGTAIDTAGGRFSDPALANAEFIVNASSEILFAN